MSVKQTQLSRWNEREVACFWDRNAFFAYLVVYSKVQILLCVMVGIDHSLFLDPIMAWEIWFWTLTLLYVDSGICFKLLLLFLGFKKSWHSPENFLPACISTLLLRQLSCLSNVVSEMQVQDPGGLCLRFFYFPMAAFQRPLPMLCQILYLPFLFTTFPLILIVLNIGNLQSTYIDPKF